MAQKKTVSIITISYNQEKYIEDTLRGFVNQKTDFSFEVIIADDASQDKTQDIVRKYEKKYPQIFNNILRTKNIGAFRNFKDAIMHAQGKYIALCEGDDYWTDPRKLQRQVNFLEKHPDHSIVFHPVRVFFENGEEEDSIIPDRKKDFTLNKLLERNFIQTNSVMYRAREKKEYAKLATDVLPGDWYMHLFHAQFGKIGFINFTMADYRRHSGGIWWTSTNANKSKFWKQYAKGYFSLYTKMLDIYGNDEEYRKILTQNMLRTLKEAGIEHGDKEDTYNLIEILRKYPESSINMIRFLIEKNTHQEILNTKNISIIEDLRFINNKLEIENVDYKKIIFNIHKSKYWKIKQAKNKFTNKLKRLSKSKLNNLL